VGGPPSQKQATEGGILGVRIAVFGLLCRFMLLGADFRPTMRVVDITLLIRILSE
jgi:hypothetical protein